jgi:hypothetical protein
METQDQEPLLAEIVENGLQKVQSELTPDENKALDIFLSQRDKGGSCTKALAYELQEDLFRLYVNGTSIQDIAKLRPNLSLGQICHAAVEYKWKETKDNYTTASIKRNEERLPFLLASSVEYIADQITASHLLNGQKIKNYILTGDPEYIKDVPLGNFKQYKELVDALVKLSTIGQPSGKGGNPSLTINNNVNAGEAPGIDAGGDTLAKLASQKKAR